MPVCPEALAPRFRVVEGEVEECLGSPLRLRHPPAAELPLPMNSSPAIHTRVFSSLHPRAL